MFLVVSGTKTSSVAPATILWNPGGATPTMVNGVTLISSV